MRRRRAEGFTLIEVVASLALIAIAATTLLVAQGRTVQHLREVYDRQRAADLARELIDQWRKEPPSATEGTFAEQPTWRWVRSEETSELTPDPLIRQVRLTVLRRTPAGTEVSLGEFVWLEKRRER